MEWYTKEVGKTLTTELDKVVTGFNSNFWKGPPKLMAATVHSVMMGKGQLAVNYFAKVMRLCKELDSQMLDDLKKTWLANCLRNDL